MGNEYGVGLFAVKNRVFSKIIQKQIEVVQDLDYYLKHYVNMLVLLELFWNIIGIGDEKSIEGHVIFITNEKDKSLVGINYSWSKMFSTNYTIILIIIIFM